MAQKVKCPLCDTMNLKENTTKIKNRYYCKDSCAEEQLAIQKVKDKDNEEWSELFEYICEIYEIDTLTGMMFSQIKKFKDEYGYTNKGIYLTLKYYYEIEDNEIKEGTGLGIIIYYYEKAKKHYIEKMKVANNEKEMETTEMIKLVEVDLSQDVYIHKSPLSFDDLEWEEDDEDD